MPAPQPIETLITRFHDDHARYRRAAYNETEARIQFINPLFEALGCGIEPYSQLRDVLAGRQAGVLVLLSYTTGFCSAVAQLSGDK